jgi:hypothetical protein
VIWGLAHPKLGEREVMTALLEADHHLVRAGQVLLGDKGFAGAAFETFVTEQLGAHFVRPDRRGEPARFGKLARVRQWVGEGGDAAAFRRGAPLSQVGARFSRVGAAVEIA